MTPRPSRHPSRLRCTFRAMSRRGTIGALVEACEDLKSVFFSRFSLPTRDQCSVIRAYRRRRARACANFGRNGGFVPTRYATRRCANARIGALDDLQGPRQRFGCLLVRPSAKSLATSSVSKNKVSGWKYHRKPPAAIMSSASMMGVTPRIVSTSMGRAPSKNDS